MVRKKFFIMLLLSVSIVARGQTSQYWFDEDYSKAVTSGVSNGSIAVDVSALQPGVHTLHYLYKNKAGVPSSTYSKTFFVAPEPAAKGVKGEYWFDQDYANKQTTAIVNGTVTIDAATLQPGIHTLCYQQVDAAGLPSVAYSHTFLVPEVATAATKGEYWFDDNYDGRKPLALSATAVGIDLAGLQPGLHAVRYHALNAAGLPSAAYSKLFWIGAGESQVVAYHYWVNDVTTDVTDVAVETPVANYQLTAQLDVAEQPIRKEKFHFEVQDGQPMMFAENTLTLVFENADGSSVRTESDYVDYRVGQAIDAKLMEPGDQQTVSVPADIQWFKAVASQGDSIAFKANRRCTMQLFSPSGSEVWTATGDKVLKAGGARAGENGTYYMALHSVTESSVADVTVDYYGQAVPMGDVNGDFKVDIVDVTSVIGYVLGQPSAGFIERVADLNGDKIINITDVTTLIDVILKK